jgi:O-antigen ligase
VVLTSQAISSRSSDVALAKESPETSSIGLRLIFWKSSLSIFADYPLLGAGTGSFANEFLSHANGYETLKADNPHNEYLLIACQLGIVGLGIFLWLLYSLFNESKRMSDMYGSALQGLVVAMAVGCLFNSFLRDHGEGHFFAIYAGMLFSTFIFKRTD